MVQHTSRKIKQDRDVKSSIVDLPGSPSTKTLNQPSLLSQNAHFDNKHKVFKKSKKNSQQPKQSQMCHVLGEVVRSAGLSSHRNSSAAVANSHRLKSKDDSNSKNDAISKSRRGCSNGHLYGSQIILGSDRDYMSVNDVNSRGHVDKSKIPVG